MKDEYGEIVELIMPIYKDRITTFHLEASSGDLIRCGDCRFWCESKKYKGLGGCKQRNGLTAKPSNWFCADGKPKDG